MAEYSDETNNQLAQMMLRLRRNPKTSTKLARLIQEVDPNLRFNDLAVEDVRAEMQQKFQDAETKREQDEALKRFAAQRRRVMSSFGDNPKEQEKHITGVEEIMQRYKLMDYDAATKIYAAEQPEPAPRPEPFQGANWMAPNTKGLFENPTAWARDEARRAIDDINQAKRTRH